MLNRKMTQLVLDRPKELSLTNFITMKRSIAEEIKKYKYPYPNMDGLLLRTTSDIVNVKMEERYRLEGKSSFTLRKCIILWMNGFTGFSIKPLRVSYVLSFLLLLCGLVSFIYWLVDSINNTFVISNTFLLFVICSIGGLLFFMLGLLGEYIGRVYMCINNSPQYIIKEKNDDEKR